MTPGRDPDPALRIHRQTVGVGDLELRTIQSDAHDVGQRVGEHDRLAVDRGVDPVRRPDAGRDGGHAQVGVDGVQLGTPRTGAVDRTGVEPVITPCDRIVERQVLGAGDREQRRERPRAEIDRAQRPAGDREPPVHRGHDGAHVLRQVDGRHLPAGDRVQVPARDVEQQQPAAVPHGTLAQFTSETLDDLP